MSKQRIYTVVKAAVAAGLVLLALNVGSSVAEAGDYGHGYGRGYSGRSYSAYRGYNGGYGYRGGYTSGWRGGYGGGFGPPVHYHLQYHPTDAHWTPYRGWHTHGHYDLVPHVGGHW